MGFVPGSVGDTLNKMRGIWHDHINLYTLSGEPLSHDEWSGTPGAAPFDNLVYIDFDGTEYRQTNVCFRGRPLHVRSFRGVLRDGLLYFGQLGPEDPTHIGSSVGPSRIVFSPSQVTMAWQNYAEPDFIELRGPGQRIRTTILYRHGQAVRTLLAEGQRLSPDASRRWHFDPRGVDGPVHDQPRETEVFRR